jgi:hypothetical protein
MSKFFLIAIVCSAIISFNCTSDEDTTTPPGTPSGKLRWTEVGSGFEQQADSAFWSTTGSCCTKIEAYKSGVKVLEIYWTPANNIAIGAKPLGITGGGAIYNKNGSNNNLIGNPNLNVTGNTNDKLSGNLSGDFSATTSLNLSINFVELLKR